MVRSALLLACAVLGLALSPPRAAAQSTSGTVRGRVVDSTGAPVARATVTVEGTGLRALSNERGEYVVARVPAGTHMLSVRRLGVRAAPVQITVRAGEEVRQDIAVTAAGAVLGAVQVVVGSRAAHTAADELAVPVDVFTIEDIQRQGTTETAQILQQLSPSVNFPRQSVSDATEIVRPFTMRGLSPDHTLVLLNGKRRHHTALVHYYGAGMAAGSSGVDMNALPASAIERLEVLREGAAAQYGSDAIAGVVNLVLREGAYAPFLTVDAGQYMPTDWPRDGRTYDVSGGWGIPIGRGSLSLSAEYRDRATTNRAGADTTDQVVAGDADVARDGKVVTKRNAVPQPNYHWGDGASKDLMTFANAKLPLGASGNTGLYAFGGYSFRQGTGFGYYRNAMSDRNWPQIYPLGFLPKFAPDVVDVSAAGGVRGALAGWSYDLGVTYGHNGFDFNLENTLNTSLGPCPAPAAPCAPGLDGVLGTADDPGIPNQTSFDAGKLKLNETILSLDASREYAIGLRSPLNVAFGAALRRENYQVMAGERASYIQGGYRDPNGDFLPSGSQVFPGFRPEDAADASRDNQALYVDLETDVAPRVLANAAGRWEHYSDFGSKLTGKLALRWQPTQQLTLRTAASTGFRAPSLNQSYYSSTSTNFRIDQTTGRPVPFDIGIFPVNSREARLLGARPLHAETSRNLSAGLAFSPARNANVTVDYYFIAVDDRVMLTTSLATDSVAAILRAAGSRAEAGQYFTNAINTHTNGVDVTGNYRFGAARGFVTLNGTYNWTTNTLVGEIPLPAELQGTGAVLFDEFGEGGLLALTRERPRWRSTLSAQYERTRWSLLGRANLYGPYESALYSYSGDFVQHYGSKAIFDAEAGFTVREGVRLALGGRNLFDTFPERMIYANGFDVFLYPAASPFGFNGRYVYARLEIAPGR